MDGVKFRNDIRVVEVPDGCCGSDALFARAAWAIHPGDEREGEGEEAYRRVIRAMLKGKHTTPFEKGLMTVYVEAPVVVWWEWTRHRFMGMDVEDFGFNLESGRYKVMEGEFYVPPQHRPLMEGDGFKPMRPELEAATGTAHFDMCVRHARRFDVQWEAYQADLAAGVAREVARLNLGFDLYYSGYVEAKPLTWMQFFSVRTRSPKAVTPSYPQWEIESAAQQCEEMFKARWPIAHAEFDAHGRSMR